ncbi:maleylpyruvate isomerase family mycothiol-dependent enzyme [Nocardioides massiliensis]|uniref:Uncharacterized protein (TIGR03083 family) n=1 Tax=Nocardioides massiliensis TaxID=1325935 RepID=A0ABT9NM20_9ACTN|nr:maleylpyruvate isomerase family mycothiol-dependent enzyme [Nocardioides massiliensis]MDP9821469.1 uncharacterized protein (TIGR03083 family) [Nocardioides massiliensis]
MNSTPDSVRLAGYVSVWQRSVDDVIALLRELEPHEWDRPTDLAGWDVRAVASHLAHLESSLAGNPQERVQVPEGLAHVTGQMSAFTEMGVIPRRTWPTEQIVQELADSVAVRAEQLAADPPTDGSARPPKTPGGIDWDWETLLSNRPLDVAMHEQDIRRATDRPGNLDSPAIAHCIRRLTPGLAFVWAKLAGAAPGQTLRVVVQGPTEADLGFTVGDNGRAVALAEPPTDPTVTVRLSTEDFLLLTGGRRPLEQTTATYDGDSTLGPAVLANLNVTP